MTEIEWLVCDQRSRMLEFLKSKKRVSGRLRKARLLAAACCRRVERLVAEKRCKRLFKEAVRFGVLDGQGQSVSLLRQAVSLAV